MRIEIERDSSWWMVKLYNLSEDKPILRVYIDFREVLQFLATIDVSEVEKRKEVEPQPRKRSRSIEPTAKDTIKILEQILDEERGKK